MTRILASRSDAPGSFGGGFGYPGSGYGARRGVKGYLNAFPGAYSGRETGPNAE